MHDRGLGEGFANIVDVHGWNYIKVGDIEAFHKRRPHQPILGTEEASTVTTRGIYADDESRGYVSGYDKRTPKWGSTAEFWWSFYDQRPWLAGAFVWTGFDYRGEPIPYKWPCTGSHFGLMDACGFPKDIYYYYQSWWSDPGDRAVLHIFPHWNWRGREGESIEVWCFSNCDEVELLLNGNSLGRKTMPQNSHLQWSVKYQPGELRALGYRNGKRIATAAVHTAGAPVSMVLEPDCRIIRADGSDVVSIAARIVDDQGRTVPTADNAITFKVSGAGHFLGVGNGDPSSHESDKSSTRRAFNGLCLALVQSTEKPGRINITAHSSRVAGATLVLSSRSTNHSILRRR
jgi:beta-galactosidase